MAAQISIAPGLSTLTQLREFTHRENMMTNFPNIVWGASSYIVLDFRCSGMWMLLAILNKLKVTKNSPNNHDINYLALKLLGPITLEQELENAKRSHIGRMDTPATRASINQELENIKLKHKNMRY